jgi:hypothetical protein
MSCKGVKTTKEEWLCFWMTHLVETSTVDDDDDDDDHTGWIFDSGK